MGKRSNFKFSEAAALNQLVLSLKRSSLTRTRPQLSVTIVAFDASNEQPELAPRPCISRRSHGKCFGPTHKKFKLQCKPNLKLDLSETPEAPQQLQCQPQTV